MILNEYNWRGLRGKRYCYLVFRLLRFLNSASAHRNPTVSSLLSIPIPVSPSFRLDRCQTTNTGELRFRSLPSESGVDRLVWARCLAVVLH